jgi:hypothetical protein
MKQQYTIYIHERPYFHEYCRIVTEYTQRELSFKSDRLVATVGILNIFAQAFGLIFFHGLPEVMFDAALLWQPTQRSKRIPNDLKTGKSPFSQLVVGWLDRRRGVRVQRLIQRSASSAGIPAAYATALQMDGIRPYNSYLHAHILRQS